MKISLITISILMGTTVAGILLPIQSIAQTSTQVKFYCGQSFEPDSSEIVPTTLVTRSFKREPLALIQWQLELGGGYTPQVRCNIVSAKFQKAWDAGKLNYLASGVDQKSTSGIICGIKNRSTACNEVNMLFTLANGAEASEAIDLMKKNIQRRTGSGPILLDLTRIIDIGNIVK